MRLALSRALQCLLEGQRRDANHRQRFHLTSLLHELVAVSSSNSLSRLSLCLAAQAVMAAAITTDYITTRQPIAEACIPNLIVV